MNSNQRDRAALFSIAAHEAIGQVRKYTGEPYWRHPAEVAGLVCFIPDYTDDMMCAAYLHDVLEDTQVKESTLRSLFGDSVTDLVVWLTDLSKPEDGNRAARKAIDCARLSAAPAAAQNVKCCDLISNSSTILQYDKNFARVYFNEILLLLQAMTKADRTIWYRAWHICQTSIKVLEEEEEVLLAAVEEKDEVLLSLQSAIEKLQWTAAQQWSEAKENKFV